MTHREEVIRDLLYRYNDLVDPQQIRGGGDTFGASLMPASYSPSVRELERLMCVMRDDRHRPLLELADGSRVSVRACWWHLNARYLTATTVVRKREVPWLDKHGRRKHRKDGSLVTTPEWYLEPSANGSKDAIVSRGIRWLSENWALKTLGSDGVWREAEPEPPVLQVRGKVAA